MNLLNRFSKKNTKFQENPTSGSRVVPWVRTDRQTDKHDEVNIRF